MKYVAIERSGGHLLGDGEVFYTEEHAINATLKAIDEVVRNRLDIPGRYDVAIERRLQVDAQGNDYKSQEVELSVQAETLGIEFVIRKIKA